MKTLVIATRNAHKTEEIRAILGEQFRFLSLADFPDAPEVTEDALTFARNASKKAIVLADWLASRQITESGMQLGMATGVGGVFVLADDSGLEVDALEGAPGVLSARFAALDTGRPGNSPTAENNAKLLRLLEGVPRERRGARFRCVIAVAPVLKAGPTNDAKVREEVEAGSAVRLFEGVCEGQVTAEPRGAGGFGYDPLFVPDGYSRTFGELSEAVKNGISHRARALSALKAAFED